MKITKEKAFEILILLKWGKEHVELWERMTDDLELFFYKPKRTVWQQIGDLVGEVIARTYGKIKPRILTQQWSEFCLDHLYREVYEDRTTREEFVVKETYGKLRPRKNCLLCIAKSKGGN